MAVVIASAGVGWWAGRSIESPAEAAARAEPPEPSLITVAVEQSRLSADVIARGDIVFDDPVTIRLSGAGGAAGVTPVVTRLPGEGAELAEGALIIEVAGRPVFLLEGVIPTYRDMRPGAEGIDVMQLESAMQRLGFLAEEPDEVWTGTTGAAVQAFYDAAGYRANAADESEQAALDAARERVRLASQGVNDAQKAVDQASGASRSEILAASEEVKAAEDAVALAVLAEKGANDAAARQVARARTTFAAAEDDAAVATERLAQALAGTHPDTGQPPTADELAALRAADDAAQLALAVASDELASSLQAQQQTAAEQAAIVRQARSRLEIAKARLNEVLAPPDRSGLVAIVASARQELSAAQEELADLQVSVGTWMPAAELVFLERVPVRVDALAVTLGSVVDGPVMTVSGSKITLRVQLDEADADRVEIGDPVLVDEDGLEAPLEGTIATIAEQAAGGRVLVEVTLESIPQELIGANVKVVIPIESTAGEVLAVPAAALSATADGSTRVEVEDEPGVTRFVEVIPGLAAGGLVEITPVDGPLAAGDRVVVGQASTDESPSTETTSSTDDTG